MITHERDPAQRTVLAVDQGTSGTKALVVCPERGVIGTGAAPVIAAVIYLLSFDRGFSGLRLVVIGIAVNAMVT
ncbi:hypothetical protein, partial [Streptomyces venezuelae]|uniref:hypothetical protein n=1 Tax=Streptomyces venezuelae TaxID=54571 RepID=UPI0036620720